MEVWVFVSVVAFLFFVIGVAEPIGAFLRIPFSVVLAVLGIIIGGAALFFLQTELTDALNPASVAILDLPIKSNVFIYFFLPVLLFQATIGMNLKRILDDWVPILVLAILAVFVATVFVGYSLVWTSALPIAACFLIGSIVSTTDPSAVVGIFRSIAAPERLTRIIEGESLLNDAAAIALFGLFMGFVMLGVPNPTLSSALVQFPLLILGGALAGWGTARLGVAVMGLFFNFPLAQLSISIALPYLAFVFSEQAVGASGVIAVVAAGLTMHLTAPGRLSPEAWNVLRETWDLLAHWAGALIFILAALLIPRFLADLRLHDIGLILVVIFSALAARVAILFLVFPVLSFIKASPAVERPYRAAILWGGLRGAVTLALALAVTENHLVDSEIKRVVGILATGFTLFTLFVQGTTLRRAIKWLGIDRLSPLDQALSRQVVAVALQTVREDVARLTDSYDLSRDIVRSEAKNFGTRLEEAIRDAEEDSSILDKDRVKLSLISIAGAERELILQKLNERLISSSLAEKLISDSDRLIEATIANGRLGYQATAREAITAGLFERIALKLHHKAGFSYFLSDIVSEKFERLLAQKLILDDLDDFIDRRIRWIHGKRVAQLLKMLVQKRAKSVRNALNALRIEYPGYADELEQRFIRRSILRLEKREYHALKEDRLIGDEVHAKLVLELAQRSKQLEKRPRLDVSVQPKAFLRTLPLLRDLDDRTQRRLKRRFKVISVPEGRSVVKKGFRLNKIFFVLSGSIEISWAGRTWHLGPGEMFGDAELIFPNQKHFSARAISSATLFELDNKDLEKNVGANEELLCKWRASEKQLGAEAIQLS